MPHREFASCIDACNRCALACDHCAVSCLREDDVKALVRCIVLDRDCAAMCRFAVELMAWGSPLSKPVCRLCAEVCKACAEECASHDMEHCRQCAEACKQCAAACEEMAGTSRPAIALS